MNEAIHVKFNDYNGIRNYQN